MRALDLDLDVYQGPFDLLLSLILKEEVDLLEVPLSEVILAYLEEREAAGAPDWDETTEFLLLMSLLLEVKSRLLLPGRYPDLEQELSPEEAREQLLSRLFQYGQFKAAAQRLRELGEGNAGCLLRPPAAEQRRSLAPVEDIAGTGDALELLHALQRMLDNRREPDTAHIAQVRVELQRQIRVIRRLLADTGRFSFDKTFGGEEQLVQALSLFALLGLMGRGELRVSQPRLFGDIVVRACEMRKSA
ncbi:MAG TPA: segregation/condensation protein A [Thermoleophilia bacterium]